MTIRVVADTNIYISALNFGGVADEVLALGRQGQMMLFISSPILKEIEGVLVQKFKWSLHEARRARRTIQGDAHFVTSKEKLQVFKRDDEPDNRILECAVAAHAHCIVSGDHELQSLRTFRSVAIVSPREFLESRLWLKT
jgi:uncharacterized protein